MPYGHHDLKRNIGKGLYTGPVKVDFIVVHSAHSDQNYRATQRCNVESGCATAVDANSRGWSDKLVAIIKSIRADLKFARCENNVQSLRIAKITKHSRATDSIAMVDLAGNRKVAVEL